VGVWYPSASSARRDFTTPYRVTRNPFLPGRNCYLIDGRWHAIATHGVRTRTNVGMYAPIATNGVRFRTISGRSGNYREKPDHQISSLLPLTISKRCRHYSESSSYEYTTTPVHTAPVSQHPRWRTACRSIRLRNAPCTPPSSVLSTQQLPQPE
jgi:hypothetical protein